MNDSMNDCEEFGQSILFTNDYKVVKNELSR